MTHDAQYRHAHDFFVKAHEKFAVDGLRLIEIKGGDYSPEPVAMTEVFFTAADIDTTPEQVLWVHVRKHLSAIANHISGQALRSEDIRSRYIDVANYMALMDSYTADPRAWLQHLIQLINEEKFPNRTPEEIKRLRGWVAFQCGATGNRGLAELLHFDEDE